MTVIWTTPARHDLRRLSRDTAARIVRAVDQFAETGQGDVKKLAGSANEWRLRVGTWRVRFTRGTGTIIVTRVLPRGRAYRD